MQNISITQNLPEARMGRQRLSFSVNLGESGFNRFLNRLPDVQRNYFEERVSVLGPNVVEITMPCDKEFPLENPKRALEKMTFEAHENKDFTTAYILSNIVRAVA